MDEKQLPYAVDAETSLTAEELQVLQRQFEREGTNVSVQTKFNYAWGLVKSSRHSDEELGVRLLQEITREYPERKRECVYYLSLGYYKLGDYYKARQYNDLLLEVEPNNNQAMSLKKLIDAKVERDGLIGLAMTGGAVAVAAAVAAFIVKKSK